MFILYLKKTLKNKYLHLTTTLKCDSNLLSLTFWICRTRNNKNQDKKSNIKPIFLQK